MGLPPLEYIDCYLDSPSFRDTIALYEKELEENAVHVKSLVKECRHMIQATEEFSKAQHSFATALSNFKFQTIGEETEAEKMIMNSLQTFATLLLTIEDYRHSMLSTISVRLLQNLERFRKEHIQKTKEEKKQFDRTSEKYYQSLERKLGVSNKKKETALQEYDQHLEIEHAGFRQASFNYVCKLQEVHAMKQYGYILHRRVFLLASLPHETGVFCRRVLNGEKQKVSAISSSFMSTRPMMLTPWTLVSIPPLLQALICSWTRG
jgi:hypothetical protein